MEAYKQGQGTLARMIAYAAAGIGLVLGVIEIYSWMHDPKQAALLPLDVFNPLPIFGVRLTWQFLVAVVLCAAGAYGLQRYLGRRTTVDTLIETESEMKKVAWPTFAESKSATLVVIFVTLIITATLALFDLGLSSFFRLIF